MGCCMRRRSPSLISGSFAHRRSRRLLQRIWNRSPGPPADVGKAKEVECFRFAEPELVWRDDLGERANCFAWSAVQWRSCRGRRQGRLKGRWNGPWAAFGHAAVHALLLFLILLSLDRQSLPDTVTSTCVAPNRVTGGDFLYALLSSEALSAADRSGRVAATERRCWSAAHHSLPPLPVEPITVPIGGRCLGRSLSRKGPRAMPSAQNSA
jgi:hypothetical protein